MPSILIVTEIQNGKIREASYELASIAQKIAGESGREVKSLVMGKGVDALAEEFSKRGGGEVYAADHDLLENNNVEARAIAIRAAIEASGADLILFSNTPTGWDVAPRVAAALDAGFVSDCFSIQAEGDDARLPPARLQRQARRHDQLVEPDGGGHRPARGRPGLRGQHRRQREQARRLPRRRPAPREVRAR